MSSKLWVAGEFLRLAILPATKNRLLSTSTTSQEWLNPTAELKYYTDPEWRARRLEVMRTRNRIRRRQDPEYRAKIRATARAWHEKQKKSETYQLWQRFCKWCFSRDWVRDQLPWKTYKPRLYPEKVEHTCMSCRFTQTHGYRLWWCQINDSPGHAEPETGLGHLSRAEKYLCSSCYSKTENIMPQGFEDVTSFKDLKARAKELGINIDKERGQVAQGSDQALQKSGPTHESKA